MEVLEPQGLLEHLYLALEATLHQAIYLQLVSELAMPAESDLAALEVVTLAETMVAVTLEVATLVGSGLAVSEVVTRVASDLAVLEVVTLVETTVAVALEVAMLAALGRVLLEVEMPVA